jgi:DNA-binding IclR family transcriptional regulator
MSDAATAMPGVPEVRAVLRAVEVLRAFSATKPLWSLAEITHATKLSKATVRRLLHTLEIAGLVAHDEASQGYALTLDLAELASRVHRGRDLVTMARPFLSQLAEMCGGVAFLWTFDKLTGVCLDRVVAASSVITPFIAPGDRSALNCGGAPRVTLAYIEPAERMAALAQPQPRRTPRSLVDPDKLERRARLIRKRGYEFVADDFIIGLAAIGAPILTPDGRFVGAFSVTNLSDRFEIGEDGRPQWLAPMQAAARRLGERLG